MEFARIDIVDEAHPRESAYILGKKTRIKNFLLGFNDELFFSQNNKYKNLLI